jgi:hypothetical protein
MGGSLLTITGAHLGNHGIFVCANNENYRCISTDDQITPTEIKCSVPPIVTKDSDTAFKTSTWDIIPFSAKGDKTD